MTNLNIYTITGIFLAVGGWLVFLTLKYSKISKKTKIIFSDKVSKNLGAMVEEYMTEVGRVNQKNKELEAKIIQIGKTADSSYHKTGFVRYNPFGDVGGDQSFSICLLNTADDGFVISSIHSRGGTRVYSKTVSRGESQYNLSEEEKKAIKVAKGGK